MFAHRGVHTSVEDENTLASFDRAICDPNYDGFECDVRLSRDGIPVVVHDRTLKRTHDVRRAVRDCDASSLSFLGIPTVKDVLDLLELHSSRSSKLVLLDIKEEKAVGSVIALLLPRSAFFLRRVVFLTRVDTTPFRVLRPEKLVFDVGVMGKERTRTGIACHFDGSQTNLACIRRALRQKVHVNLYAPNPSHVPQMVRLFGHRCSLTVRST